MRFKLRFRPGGSRVRDPKAGLPPGKDLHA